MYTEKRFFIQKSGQELTGLKKEEEMTYEDNLCRSTTG